jgi:hypothetical protein
MQTVKRVFKIIDTSRDQMALYIHLCKQAMRLKGEATQRRVMSILDNAADNAAQTIYNEKAAPVDHWNRIFVGSIELLLSSGGENTTAVINWFKNRNISA